MFATSLDNQTIFKISSLNLLRCVERGLVDSLSFIVTMMFEGGLQSYLSHLKLKEIKRAPEFKRL